MNELAKARGRLHRFEVTRAEYRFGSRRVPGGGAGNPERPFPAFLGPAHVYGLSIHPDSEVRAVMVQPVRGGAPVALIEGHPLAFQADFGAEVILDRYDWTDGRLILEVATHPDDVPLLSRFISPIAQIHVDTETYDHTVPESNNYLARPRGCRAVMPAFRGRVGSSATCAFEVNTRIAATRSGPMMSLSGTSTGTAALTGGVDAAVPFTNTLGDRLMFFWDTSAVKSLALYWGD